MITDNGIEYGFKILPRFDKVHAEIYTVFQPYLNGEKHHIHAQSKDFKRMFKKIGTEDYNAAREWVDCQMELIFDSNRS